MERSCHTDLGRAVLIGLTSNVILVHVKYSLWSELSSAQTLNGGNADKKLDEAESHISMVPQALHSILWFVRISSYFVGASSARVTHVSVWLQMSLDIVGRKMVS